MALRLKPETRERWEKRTAQQFVTPRSFRGEHNPVEGDPAWRPVPRSEPVAEPAKPETRYDTHSFDIYYQTWVDE